MMLMKKFEAFRIEIKLLVIFILMLQMNVFAENAIDASRSWILGAEQFTFAQKKERTKPEEEASKILPMLIMEKISSNSERRIPQSESLDRVLDTLLKERLSLFLELSAAEKKRDSLILNNYSNATLQSNILKQEKAINLIHEKIKRNLDLQEKEIAKIKTNGKKNPPKDILLEKVNLYKDDYKTLFTVSGLEDNSKLNWKFTNAVSSAKINGLLTGSIIFYGEYISVSSELLIYPGGTSTGVITEIGLITDLNRIAENIAFRLAPKIADTMSVELRIVVNPEEARKNCSMTIDSVVYKKMLDRVTVNSGIHLISISSEGFNRETFNYSYTGTNVFNVEINMQKSDEGKIDLAFNKATDGLVFSDVNFAGNFDEFTKSVPVKVNGNPVLGHFENNTGEVMFYYIPEKYAVPGKKLSANVKVFDVSANIEKRRRLLYFSYSALIVSLPLLFYSYGNYLNSYNAYTLDYKDSVTIGEINRYRAMTFASIGVSVTCGVWFMAEIVAYLHSVSKALPVNAYPISEKKFDLLTTTPKINEDVTVENKTELNNKDEKNE